MPKYNRYTHLQYKSIPLTSCTRFSIAKNSNNSIHIPIMHHHKIKNVMYLSPQNLFIHLCNVLELHFSINITLYNECCKFIMNNKLDGNHFIKIGIKFRLYLLFSSWQHFICIPGWEPADNLFRTTKASLSDSHHYFLNRVKVFADLMDPSFYFTNSTPN